MKRFLILLVFSLTLFGLSAQVPQPFREGLIIGSFSADPTGYAEGQIYWNSVSKRFRQYNGILWENVTADSNSSLEAVVINSASVTLNTNDVLEFKQFFIDPSQTDVTITVPQVSWTSLLYLNIYHEGTGNVTIQGDTGVTLTTRTFNNIKRITYYSDVIDVWKVKEENVASGSGGLGGSIADTQIAVGNSSGEIEGSSNLTFDSNGEFTALQNRSGSFMNAAKFLNSGMSGGNYYELLIGRDNSTSFNRGQIAFRYLGGGNASNYLSFGLRGNGDILTLDGNGLASFSGDVDIDGSLTLGDFTLPNTDGTNGQYLETDGAGNVSWVSPSIGGADNLGNHTATQDLVLGNNDVLGTDDLQFYISNTGGDGGFEIYQNGNKYFDLNNEFLEIGNNNLQAGQMRLFGNATTGGALIQFDNGNSNDTNTSTYVFNAVGDFELRDQSLNDILVVDDVTLGLTAPSTSISDINTLGNPALITKEYADANYSGGSGDNLGNHTATEDIKLNGNNINGTGNIDIETASDTDAIITLTATHDSSNASPIVELKRNSSSVSDGDYLGQIKFTGENDVDEQVMYAKITGKTSDVSDATEDGLLEIAVKRDGTNVIISRFTDDALKLINSTNLEVAGNLDLTGNLLLDDSSTIEYGIGTALSFNSGTNILTWEGGLTVDQNFVATTLTGDLVTNTVEDVTSIDLLTRSNQVDFGGTASSATTFTLNTINVGGYAEILINSATEPTVTGATKFPNTASFIASTDMILCIKDFNGTRKYWFVEF